MPPGWVETPINDLFIVNPRNAVEDTLTVSFVPMTLINDGFSNCFTFQEKSWGEVKSGFTHFQDEDVGLAKITPCLENRKSVVFRELVNGIGAGTTELHIFRPICDNIVLSDYLLWYFKSESFISSCIGAFAGAVGQQRVGKDYIANLKLLLPPLVEQRRIVTAIESAFAVIDEIERNKTDLQAAVIAAKQKILSLAIRGKLVPQDPDDEPASVLLDRIRTEREALIKTGKIKRSKGESAVIKSDDNSYYSELPKSWILTTLLKITNPLVLNDGDWILSENMVPCGNVKLVQLGSVGYMEYFEKGFKYLTLEMFKKLNCTEIYSGYLLINRLLGDRLNVCILPDITGPIITTVDTCWIAPNDNYYLKFLMYVVASDSFQTDVFLNSAGSTRKRISKGNLIQITFPFPPLAEQHRIVIAIESAFEQLDNIAATLL